MCKAYGVVWHIVFAVLGGAVVAVGIDAEHAEVARLTGPHPVVGVASELAQCLGSGEYKAYVSIYLVLGNIVCISVVICCYAAFHPGVCPFETAFHPCTDSVSIE